MKALSLVWWNVRLKKVLQFRPMILVSVEKVLPTKGIWPVMEGLHRFLMPVQPFSLSAKITCMYICVYVFAIVVVFIPYLRHGDYCLFTIVPAIGMAGYQCLMPLASFICWNIIGILWFDQSDNGTQMTQIRWMTALLTLMFFCLISKLIAHNICILIFVEAKMKT